MHILHICPTLQTHRYSYLYIPQTFVHLNISHTFAHLYTRPRSKYKFCSKYLSLSVTSHYTYFLLLLFSLKLHHLFYETPFCQTLYLRIDVSSYRFKNIFILFNRLSITSFYNQSFFLNIIFIMFVKKYYCNSSSDSMCSAFGSVNIRLWNT